MAFDDPQARDPRSPRPQGSLRDRLAAILGRPVTDAEYQRAGEELCRMLNADEEIRDRAEARE